MLLLGVVAIGLSWVDRGGPAPARRVAMWVFAGLMFFTMAIDETSGLHEIFGKRHGDGVLRFALTAPHVGNVAVCDSHHDGARSDLPATVAPQAIPCRCRDRLVLWVVGQTADQVSPFVPDANIVIEEGLEMLGATVLLATLAQFLVRSSAALRAAPGARMELPSSN